MTMPRQVLPGRSYFITRSTRSRRFFLCPNDTLVNTIFMFCIAVASYISGVQVHCVCVMSTHVHLVVTDVRGELPRFTHWLFRHTSLCLKTLRGIEENLWSAEREEPVVLVTAEALLEAMAYVMANPASAGLVKQSRYWPGLVTRPVDLHGQSAEVKPPELVFRFMKPATYRIVLPELLETFWTAEELVETLKERVREHEREAAATLRSEGRTPLGVEGIRRTRPFDRAKTPRREDEPGDEGAGLVPRFKALCKRTLKRARKELREFWKAYREALGVLRETGEAEFPAGTWYLRQHLGVRVLELE